MAEAYKSEMVLDIQDFHEKFGLNYNEGPRPLPEDLLEFRKKFMQEELDEYGEACVEGDMNKAFDALIDLVYVALGTAYLHGFPWDQGWLRVQAANMAKVRAVNNDPRSKRASPYDVVKPAGWMAPDHSDLVRPRNETTNTVREGE